MHKILHSAIFALISLTFATSSAVAGDLCYKADRNDFNQTLGTSYDIIFDLSDLKKKNWIYLSFSSLLPVPYADDSFSGWCWKKDKDSNIYQCSGDCDSGQMKIRLEENTLEVNVQFATITNTPDDPIMHEIKSKQNKFTSAHRTVCPKPHKFNNKQEKHLPFVCYAWKEKKVIEGKEKSIYWGCTRYDQVCKNISTKHFGKYTNDHESYKAYLRCQDSTPNLVPKTSSSSNPQTLIKSEKRKKILFNSITIKDVIIYDLDYYNDLVIAVGEDASEETRKLQAMDEHHESLMLRSTDGGKHWSKLSEGEESSVPHDTVIVLNEKRILVASSIEAAGGSIILSEDAGKTWETRFDEAIIESLKQIKGNTLIAKTLGSTIKSIDGGKNWVKISTPEERK